VWRSTYVFDISILPERCDIIDIGQFAFNRDNGVDTHVKESDKGNFKQLQSCKEYLFEKIYTFIVFGILFIYYLNKVFRKYFKYYTERTYLYLKFKYFYVNTLKIQNNFSRHVSDFFFIIIKLFYL